MFAGLAIALCALEMLVTYSVTADAMIASLYWQIEMALFAGLALYSTDTQRDKSVLAIMALWFFWVMITDLWPEYIIAPISGLETMAFSFLVFWAFARPYLYPSAELVGENVYIGFYQGTHAPFLSSLGALFGLPFSSIVIASGTVVLRASKVGKLVTNNIAVVDNGNYVFVDTGVKATPEIFATMAKCSGEPTKAFGVFRTKCVEGCEPVLKLLGMKPKSWAHYMPSIFYYQAVRGNRG